jgi:hypothetical protein
VVPRRLQLALVILISLLLCVLLGVSALASVCLLRPSSCPVADYTATGPLPSRWVYRNGSAMRKLSSDEQPVWACLVILPEQAMPPASSDRRGLETEKAIQWECWLLKYKDVDPTP